MKTISLEAAISILASCTAVYVDGFYVTFPNLIEPENRDEGVFLELAKEENDVAEEHFNEKDNALVEVSFNGELILTTTLGQKTTVMPLVTQPVGIPA